jgi:imidazolonepropionase-like amidohydrolase
MRDNQDIILANARIFDGVSDVLSEPSWVKISGGHIAEISRRPLTSKAAPVLDIAQRTLMPGLIDAHFHAYAAEANIPYLETLPLTYLAHHARHLLEAALRRGFTTVRDAGGADYGLWRAVDEGLLKGPRIFYSGRAISQTGGHGDSRAQYLEPCNCRHVGNLSEVADGVDAVRTAAREALRRGAHQIKIFVSGGVSSPTDPIDMVQFSADEIRAAVEEAHSRHTYVMAHAYTGESILHAVNCGVRSIEHGNLLTQQAAETMATHGAFLVPTLATYDALSLWGAREGLSATSQAKLSAVAARGHDAIALARKAGVQIGFGTDLLGRMHAHQLHEFRLRAPIEKPADILRSATSVNAKLLNQEGKLGCIREGAVADLVAVNDNPLVDISTMWREPPRLVIKDGAIIVRNLDESA